MGQVTRIEVHGPMGKQMRTINDPKEIDKVVAYVDGQRQGWGAMGGLNDIFGTPVPDVIADFYDGQLFSGHFGVGSGFFETQRGGAFVSKDYGSGGREDFLRVLGVPLDVTPYGDEASTQPTK
jgi:hypothetical protein